MTPTTLFLYAAVLCFLVYSCVCDTPSEDAKKRCDQYSKIKTCNDAFKQVFTRAKAGRGRKGMKGVYCRALQVFMDCLEYSLERCAGGAWLKNYSLVVLQHGVMDKKCGVCPRHDYRDLERALNAKIEPDYVGFDVCPRCAKGVHRKCVVRFLRKMKSDTNICHDVQEFINCYKDAGDPKKPACAKDKIVKSFSRLCSKLGEQMLEEDRKHPGLMC